jgi:hypothetical protein
MEKIFETYRPNGFHTVTTYLFVDKPQLLIDFLKNAFLAKEINRSINPKNEDIANCILQIGRTANSTYPKGGVSCSKDSFVVNQTLVFQIKFCGKSPALRVAAKR